MAHKIKLGLLGVVALAASSTFVYADTLYRELSIGMSGPDVSALQSFLAKDKTIYPQGKVTGYFGPLTKSAILKFQRKNGISAVGRVGPQTLKAVNAQMNQVVVINPTTSTTSPAIIASGISSFSSTSTSTSPTVPSDTTLIVSFVPLLSGGVAHAGKTVPVSYLQITNTGKNPATLTGFWVKQNGSAPVQTIIGLTTVDDKGGSRGATEAIEGATPFKDGLAFAPTNAVFAPGQMRLFTIKVVLSNNVASYVGTNLMIDVSSIATNAKVQAAFPIRGVTWTLAN